MRLRTGTVASSMAFISAWMTKEEALFWLGLSITVLQLIYDFYRDHTRDRKDETIRILRRRIAKLDPDNEYDTETLHNS